MIVATLFLNLIYIMMGLCLLIVVGYLCLTISIELVGAFIQHFDEFKDWLKNYKESKKNESSH